MARSAGNSSKMAEPTFFPQGFRTLMAQTKACIDRIYGKARLCVCDIDFAFV